MIDTLLPKDLKEKIAALEEERRQYQQRETVTDALFHILETAPPHADKECIITLLQEAFDLALENAHISVSLYESASDSCFFPRGHRHNIPQPQETRFILQLANEAISHNRPILLDKTDITQRIQRARIQDLPTHSMEIWLGIPVQRGQHAMDVITIQSSSATPRTQTGMQALIRLADQIALIFKHCVEASESHTPSEEQHNLNFYIHKQEILKQLMGGFVHFHNNMIGVIIGHAEMGLYTLEEKHPLHTNLVNIKNAAKRCAHLNRQLVTFSHPHPDTHLQIIGINRETESILSLLQATLGKQLEISWNPDKALWPVQLDPSLLHDILLTLCISAKQTIPDCDTLHISTSNCRIEEIVPEAGLRGDYICICFENKKQHAQTKFASSPSMISHTSQQTYSAAPLASLSRAIEKNHGTFVERTSAGNRIYILLFPRHIRVR